MQEIESPLFSAFLNGLSQTMTWLLVVIGWIVVSDQQYHRELIKARREKIDDLRKKLRELEEFSRKFHTSSYDIHLMHNIMRMTAGISMELSLLCSEKIIGMGTVEDMVFLRQSITAENFDAGSHCEAPDARILTKIDESYRSLDRQLALSSNLMQRKRQTIFESIRDIKKRLY